MIGIFKHPLLAQKGQRVLLLGNEAIARGAIEAGVCFASAYPGTPSTEIVESIAEVAKEVGVTVEWSVNEKVAFEAAYGAAICGLRSLTAMKHVGLNVASDILMSSAYSGVRGGFVVVSADDPNAHSSQNEQDNRWYGHLAHVPVLEPSSPRDAYALAKLAFGLSEKLSHPVILRSTTRVSHTRQPVLLADDPPSNKSCEGSFEKNLERWVLIPAHAMKMKERLVKVWRELEEGDWGSPLVEVLNPGAEKAIVAAGAAFPYVEEALEVLGAERKATVVKLSLVVPLPAKPLSELLSTAQEVLVVEELDPVVETELRALANRLGLRATIRGKDLVPLVGELSTDRILEPLAKFLGVEAPPRPQPPPLNLSAPLPPRPPVLCAGCPHRLTYYIMKTAANRLGLRNVIYTGDIGCYTLGYQKPFETQMTCFEMGGSIGVAHGISKAVKGVVVVAVIGDSTFFHAGLPPAINVVYNRGRAVILVLDNFITAMTGHQPHPGTGYNATGEESPVVPIESLLQAMGYSVYVIHPLKIRESIDAAAKALREHLEGLNVAIVSRMKCSLEVAREARRKVIRLPVYSIDEGKCTGCMACVNLTACPAIVVPEGAKKPKILEGLCAGCGLCAYVCPYGAVRVSRPGDPGWEDLWLKRGSP